MKNIFLLPTYEPSNLTVRTATNKLMYSYKQFSGKNGDEININQHLYITSDEEIKEGDWCLDQDNILFQYGNNAISNISDYYGDMKKVILTTDVTLITNGIQFINDDFLEWFGNNSNCEYVEIKQVEQIPDNISFGTFSNDKPSTELVYEIIIPKEKSNYNMKEEILKERYKQDQIEELKEKLGNYAKDKNNNIYYISAFIAFENVIFAKSSNSITGKVCFVNINHLEFGTLIN